MKRTRVDASNRSGPQIVLLMRMPTEEVVDVVGTIEKLIQQVRPISVRDREPLATELELTGVIQAKYPGCPSILTKNRVLKVVIAEDEPTDARGQAIEHGATI